MDKIQVLKTTIQARANELSAFYNAHDYKGMAACYDQDAVFTAPGFAPAKGPEAIEQRLTTMSEAMSDLEIITDDVRPLDDAHLIELGHANYTVKDEREIQVKTSGNYVVVWEKGADGGWHILSDIFTEGPQH